MVREQKFDRVYAAELTQKEIVSFLKSVEVAIKWCQEQTASS